MTEREFLLEQLALLQKAYHDGAQPIIKQLVAVEALKVPRYAFNPTTVAVRSFEGVGAKSNKGIPPCRYKNFDGSPAYTAETCRAVPALDETVVSVDENNQYAVRGKSFADAWNEKEKQGYGYGKDALEGVRLGWDMACATLLR